MIDEPGLELTRALVGSRLELRRWTRTARGTRVFAPAAHDAIELAWIERGAVRYRVGARTHVVEPGRVFLVPAGVEHETAFVEQVRGLAIGIAPEHAIALAQREPRFTRGLELAEGRPLPEPLATLCRLLARELDSDAPGREIVAEGLVDALLVELLRDRGRTSPLVRGDRRIATAIARMRGEFGEPLSVADLARSVGMTRFHFARLFARETGKSPRDYLQEIRLAEAARRLARDHDSIAAIAHGVGIGDPPRFTRQFRRLYGVTPSQFRRGDR